MERKSNYPKNNNLGMNEQTRNYLKDLRIRNTILKEEVLYLELNYKKTQLMQLLSNGNKSSEGDYPLNEDKDIKAESPSNSNEQEGQS